MYLLNVNDILIKQHEPGTPDKLWPYHYHAVNLSFLRRLLCQIYDGFHVFFSQNLNIEVMKISLNYLVKNNSLIYKIKEKNCYLI